MPGACNDTKHMHKCIQFPATVFGIIYKAAACLSMLASSCQKYIVVSNGSANSAALASARLLLGYCFHTCTDDNAVLLLILIKVYVYNYEQCIYR